jgi:hypothetical protein
MLECHRRAYVSKRWLFVFCLLAFSTEAAGMEIGLFKKTNGAGQITSVTVNTKPATTFVFVGLNGTNQSGAGNTVNGLITFPFTPVAGQPGTVTVTALNETWSNRVPNNTVVLSDQERAAQKAKKLTRLNGLPFDDSSSLAFVSDLSTIPGVFDDLQLTDSSTGTSYELTSLQVFVDLDPAFFNQTDFDSPQAIATGMLNSDISNVELSANSFIGFGAGPAIPDTYVLILGTANAILSDGSLGSPTEFSFADLVSVPEPDTLALSVLGFALSIVFSLTRRLPSRQIAPERA